MSMLVISLISVWFMLTYPLRSFRFFLLDQIFFSIFLFYKIYEDLGQLKPNLDLHFMLYKMEDLS